MDTQKINIKVEVDTIDLDKAIDKMNILISQKETLQSNECINVSDKKCETERNKLSLEACIEKLNQLYQNSFAVFSCDILDLLIDSVCYLDELKNNIESIKKSIKDDEGNIKKKTIIGNSIDYSIGLNSKDIIDIDEVRRVKEFLKLINERDLRCFKFIEDNKFIEVSDKAIDKFAMTGLSNVDFIMSGEYRWNHDLIKEE